MRKLLVRILLDRLLPQACPYEDFFSAGPTASGARPRPVGRRETAAVARPSTGR